MGSNTIFSPETLSSLDDGKGIEESISETATAAARSNLWRAALELADAVRTSKLKPTKLDDALKFIGLKPSPEVEGALADALWYSWLQCEGSKEETAKSNVADCAKEAMKLGWVSKRVVMEVSEGEFLEWAGLVVNYRDTFRRKEIRSNTRHVYTQRKYNLLREESEGYSKLVTLLNQAGAGALAPARVGAVLGEIKALIGYFDLDPNRACSLVFDAFTAQPHNGSFLRLASLFSADSLTQLLGFHFSRDTTGELPQGLYTAAAKAIGAGLVPLEALLAHLSPKDDEITAAWKEGAANLDAAVKQIGVISLTAGIEQPATEEEQPQQQQQQQPRRTKQSAIGLDLDPRPLASNLIDAGSGALEQRTSLLAALLQVPGAWEQARQLMQWLAVLGVKDVAVFPKVGEALCSLLAEEIDPQYQRLHPGGMCQEFATASTPAKLEGGVYITGRAVELLRLVGLHLYHDIPTLTRLIRLVGAVLAQDQQGQEQSDRAKVAIEILGSHIMPAAALIPGNAALSLEVWSALTHLPYTERFGLYGKLKEASNEEPLLRASAKLAETEVRRILRRVTAPANRREAKLTMRPLGRMLAKITHANPLGVAEQLLRQVMGMPGMVASISEALRFLTPLAFDVATFAILCQLASRKRKLKEDGINLEEWFQWLAAFTGVLARKNDAVEVTALAQYVANQLKGCESLDILVLWEIVATMAGVAPVFEVSDGQLDALAGSETLISQVILSQVGEGSAGGNERATARGRQRLLRALCTGPPNDQLAVPLLILLAQQRKLITLQPQSSHLKLVAELYDRCQEVTVQFAEFLRKALTLEEYAALLPSIKDLATEYRIDPEIIFELHRPLIRDIMPPSAPVKEEVEEGEQLMEEVEDGAAEASNVAGEPDHAEPAAVDEDEEGEIADAVGMAVDSADVEDGEVPEVEDQDGSGGEHNIVGQQSKRALTWEALAEETATLAPEGGFRGMSQTLFVTFWALGLYDLDVPKTRYATSLTQVRSAARAARDDYDAARRDAQRPNFGAGSMRQGGYGGAQPPPPPPPSADLDTLAKEVERLESVAAKLSLELIEQQTNAGAVDARLRGTGGAWVMFDTPEAQAAAAREFVQFCILPRVLNSPADALYCARFLRKAHSLGPPRFRLLAVVDRIFKELGFLVRCCTSREATNLGIFFAELMAMVSRWREPENYARHCASSEAFRSYKAGALEQVSHSEFVKLSANWHRKLTLDVFRTCLGSADYMQMKNALLVLNRMVRIYPATKEDITELLRMLSPIRDNDPREDLKTLARMYCTALEMAQRDKSRAVVATRQEYAGLPPPPRKKPVRQPAEGGALQKKERTERREAPTEDNEKEREKERGREKEKEKAPAKDEDKRRERREESVGQGRDREHQRDLRGPRDLRDQDRNGRDGRAEGGAPPSRAIYASEDRGDKGADKRDERGERPRGRGEDRRSALRVDAPEFEPGSTKDSRRGRPAEDLPAGRERDARRPRRDERSSRDVPVVQQRDLRDQPPGGADRQGQAAAADRTDRQSGRQSERDSMGKRKRDDEVGSGPADRHRRTIQSDAAVEGTRADPRGGQTEQRGRSRSITDRDEMARRSDGKAVDLAPRRDRPREPERDRGGRDKEREKERDREKDLQRDVREPEQQRRDREREREREGQRDRLEDRSRGASGQPADRSEPVRRRQEEQPPQEERNRPAFDDGGHSDADSGGSQEFGDRRKRQKREDRKRRKEKVREKKEQQQQHREDQRIQAPAAPLPPLTGGNAPLRLRGRLGFAPTIVNEADRRAEPAGDGGIGDRRDKREEHRPLGREDHQSDRDRGRDRGREQGRDGARGRDRGRDNRGRDRDRGRPRK